MTNKKSASKITEKVVNHELSAPLISLINMSREVNIELRDILFEIQESINNIRALEPEVEQSANKEDVSQFKGGAMLELDNHVKSLQHTLNIAQNIRVHLKQII